MILSKSFTQNNHLITEYTPKRRQRFKKYRLFMWGATKDTPRRNDPVSGEMESPRSLSRKSGKKLLLKWQWNTWKENGKNLHKWIHLVICEASNTASLFDVSDGGNDWKVLHIQVIIYFIWTLSQLVYFLSLTLTRVELKIDKLVWSLHTFSILG